MYKEMYVEYTAPEFGDELQSERMSWGAFCEACMEWGVVIHFCCSVDDPRINIE